MKSIADNYKNGATEIMNKSSYFSPHASPPKHERGAKEIVINNEREDRQASSDLIKNINKKIKLDENIDPQSSLYSSRDISTQNKEKIRDDTKKEKS